MEMTRRTMFKFLILQLAFSYSLAEDPTAAPTPYPTTAGPTTYPIPTTARPTTYPTTAPNPDGCPVGWVQSTEGCFLFHHTGKTDPKEEDKSQDAFSNWTHLETGPGGMRETWRIPG